MILETHSLKLHEVWCNYTHIENHQKLFAVPLKKNEGDKPFLISKSGAFFHGDRFVEAAYLVEFAHVESLTLTTKRKVLLNLQELSEANGEPLSVRIASGSVLSK